MALVAGNTCWGRRSFRVHIFFFFFAFFLQKRHLRHMNIYIYIDICIYTVRTNSWKSWVFARIFQILKHDCFDLTHGFVKKGATLEEAGPASPLLGFHCPFVPWKFSLGSMAYHGALVCLILRSLLSKLSITWDLLKETAVLCNLYFPWFVSSHLTLLLVFLFGKPEAFTLNGW